MEKTIDKYPLQWPLGYPRTKWPVNSRFGNQSFARCRDEIFRQLELMLDWQEKKSIVLSTNIPLRLDGLPYANYRQPEDVGVAVYFQYKKKQVAICCDQWKKIEHNMWACAKTIEALRAIDRWGVSDFMERSFQGFAELPPPAPDNPVQNVRQWWEVMNYSKKPGNAPWEWEGVQAQYKSLAKVRHPDVVGGSTSAFQELQDAFTKAKYYFGK